MLVLFSLLATSAPLRADLPKVALRYAERIHAPTRLSVETPARISWKIHIYGVDGTLIQEIAKGKIRQRLDLPTIPLTKETVLDGGVLSVQELGGPVLRAGGVGRATAIVNLAFVSGAWLLVGAKVAPNEAHHSTLSLSAAEAPDVTINLMFDEHADIAESHEVVRERRTSTTAGVVMQHTRPADRLSLVIERAGKKISLTLVADAIPGAF